ncbi:hypothetical protein G6514_000543 [Epicoccum nigrum]|nr:hypothetical protein G6514_000543 [Epicoccum nigrum]
MTTTVVNTPSATTIPNPVGFFPVLKTGAATVPAPTSAVIGRHRRASLQSRARRLDLLRHLPITLAENTAGYIVLDDGEGKDLRRTFPVYVECQVSVNINSTETTIVTGEPVTSVLVPATATAVSTETFTTTQTVVSVAAQPTEYAACQPNNIVNNIIGDDNQPICFDRFIFANSEGFPIMNILVVNTISAINCCIVCQRQGFCAGTFYVPSRRECHVLLTQAAPTSSVPSLAGPSSLPPFPPPSNTSLSYPIASGAPYPAGNNSAAALPTAASGMLLSTMIPVATLISSSIGGIMSIQPIVEAPSSGTFEQPSAGTCSAGSLSLYLGKTYGRVGFDPSKAIVISNGPCGREGVEYDQAAPVSPEQLTQLSVRSLHRSS